MKSFTLRGIDDELARSLQERARRDGRSVNQTMKALLRRALGLDVSNASQDDEQFLGVFDAWLEDEPNGTNALPTDLESADTDEWTSQPIR